MTLYLFMDIDGVIIRNLAGRDPTKMRSWDEEARQKLGIDPNLMSECFFKKRFKSVLLGRVDLKDALTGAIHEMKLSCKADEVVNIWFSGDSQIDTNLLGMIDSLTSGGRVRAFLATNQEKYRAHYLWETIGLKDHFEDMFFSGEIGAFKIHDAYYRYVHKKLRINPNREDILFFDDGADNIAISKAIGWNAYLYKDIEDFSQNPEIMALMESLPL